jgi:hypothetical protein
MMVISRALKTGRRAGRKASMFQSGAMLVMPVLIGATK